MYFFLGAWLATFLSVAMGFAALLHICFTVTVLALICRFQVNFLPSTYLRISDVRPIQHCCKVLVELCSLMSGIRLSNPDQFE
jgi:hypothetical protein